MKRTPIYSETRQRRIVSCPNGLWQSQRLTAAATSNKHDPWEPTHRPTTFNEAFLQAQLGRGR